MIAPHHSRRMFVDRLDFLITTGWRTTQVITDLGVMASRDGELTLTGLHPRVEAEQVREATGWPLHRADELTRTPPPTDVELSALRELIARG